MNEGDSMNDTFGKPSYLLILPLSFLVPLVFALILIIGMKASPDAALLASGIYLPMGILSSIVLVDALRKKESKKEQRFFWIAYFLSLPLGILVAFYYSFKTGNAFAGALTGGIFMSTITYIVAFIQRSKAPKISSSDEFTASENTENDSHEDVIGKE